MSYGLRFIQDTIRRLARRYGLSIKVCNTSATVDRDTGEVTQNVMTQAIKRALVLESKGVTGTTSDLLRMLTVGAVGTTGQYGAEDRTIVFLYKDLNGFIFNSESYIEFENQRWEIIEITRFESNEIYAVRCRRTIGDVTPYTRPTVQTISIGQTVEVTHVQS